MISSDTIERPVKRMTIGHTTTGLKLSVYINDPDPIFTLELSSGTAFALICALVKSLILRALQC
jgi:hypothetical protein